MFLDYSLWHKIYKCTFKGWALLLFHTQLACDFKRLYICRKWNPVHRQYPYGLFDIKRITEPWMSNRSFCHSWIKKTPTYLYQQPLAFKTSIPNILIISMWINFLFGCSKRKIHWCQLLYRIAFLFVNYYSSLPTWETA